MNNFKLYGISVGCIGARVLVSLIPFYSEILKTGIIMSDPQMPENRFMTCYQSLAAAKPTQVCAGVCMRAG